MGRQENGSASERDRSNTKSNSACRTSARASPPSISTASSSASTVSTKHVPANPAAPASDWRSSSTSSRPTAATSEPKANSASALRSTSPCPWPPNLSPPLSDDVTGQNLCSGHRTRKPVIPHRQQVQPNETRHTEQHECE